MSAWAEFLESSVRRSATQAGFLVDVLNGPDASAWRFRVMGERMLPRCPRTEVRTSSSKLMDSSSTVWCCKEGFGRWIAFPATAGLTMGRSSRNWSESASHICGDLAKSRFAVTRDSSPSVRNLSTRGDPTDGSLLGRRIRRSSCAVVASGGSRDSQFIVDRIRRPCGEGRC